MRLEDVLGESVGVSGHLGLEAHLGAQVRLVKKYRHCMIFRKGDGIRLTGIDLAAISLPGRHNGELDAIAGQDFQGFQVDGRFGQPHPLRAASKAVFEIGNPPIDLGNFIVDGAERQDGMVVCLGHSIAHAVAPHVGLVLPGDQPGSIGIVALHPTRQGRADVKADLGEVIQFRIRAVAFCVDAGVPIGIGGGPTFLRYDTGQRVFTRRLVEVTMNAKSADSHARLRSSGSGCCIVPHHYNPMRGQIEG